MRSRMLVAFTVIVVCLAGVPLIAAPTAAETLMNATFKVFNNNSTATGFLIADPAPEASGTSVILVTANHVLKKVKGDHILLVCRIKDEQGAWQRHDHKVLVREGDQELWTSHASQDVAAMRIQMPSHAIFKALPLSYLAGERRAEELGLAYGVPLIFCCYPYRTEASQAGFPILRTAIVSGYPLFPCTEYPTVFHSAPACSGDSGAPIAMVLPDSEQKLAVIGLVVTRTQQNERMQTENWDFKFKRDMDLGSFLHAEFILECIEKLP